MLRAVGKYKCAFCPRNSSASQEGREGRDVEFANSVDVHFSLIANIGLLGRVSEYNNEKQSGKRELVIRKANWVCET